MSSAAQRNAERRVDLIRHIGGPLSPAEADDIRKQCAWEEVDAWLDTAEQLRTRPVLRFVLAWTLEDPAWSLPLFRLCPAGWVAEIGGAR